MSMMMMMIIKHQIQFHHFFSPRFYRCVCGLSLGINLSLESNEEEVDDEVEENT